MSVYKRGKFWWYKFRFANRLIREPAKTESKTVAKDAEKKRHRELEEGFNNLSDNRAERVQSITTKAEAYLHDYKLRHRAGSFAQYALGHVTRHLGAKMLVDIAGDTVKQYQTARLKEGASPKSINEEVGFLLRLLGDRGDSIRLKLRREKSLKLKTDESVGKAFSFEQKEALLEAAVVTVASKNSHAQKGTRSPNILPAMVLALNTGMRDAEIRTITWAQVDLEKRFLTIGKAKTNTEASRTIPLNCTFPIGSGSEKWYKIKFGAIKPELFPWQNRKTSEGKKRPLDPLSQSQA